MKRTLIILFIAILTGGTRYLSGQGDYTDEALAPVKPGSQKERLTNTWTGGAAEDYWNLAGNWSLGHEPAVDEMAVIPSGSGFHVIVDNANGVCYSLNVGNDVLFEIRDNSLTIDQDLYMNGTLEMDNSTGVLTIGDGAFWYSGSSADMQANAIIWVYGNWVFHVGTNVNMTNGRVLFTGTSPSLVFTYDTDASFYSFGNYKSGGGYVEHNSASTQPLRTNSYFYLHYNSEFRTTSSQSIIVKGYFSKTASAICNLSMGTIVMDGTSTNIYFDAPGHFNNLTISPSTSITLQDSIDVDGDLLIEQGTLNANGKRIRITGDWNNTVGDAGFTETGSRVIFHQPEGPSSYIYSGENFDTLEVYVFDKVIMIGLADPVTCDHLIMNGGGISVTNSTFTADDLVQNGIYGYWFVNTGSTVNLYQDASDYIDLYGTLNISGGTMNVYGGADESYWGFFSNGTVNMSSGVLDVVNYGIHIFDYFLFTDNITGGTMKVATQFNVYRTDFNPTGGTIEFRSSGVGEISHYPGSNFYNILINKITSTVLLSSDIDINGNLTIDQGILDVSAGNYAINIAGNWTNNVDLTGFAERNGRVTFDGPGARDINSSETFYKLILNKTFADYYGLELDEGIIVRVNDSLKVMDGTLEINNTSILDVRGPIVISSGAGLNADDPSTNIWITGDFTDNNATFTATQGFYAGNTSTVLFHGTSNQNFQTAGTTGVFNNLTIDKGSSIFYTYEDLEIRGNLSVVTGSWQDKYGSMNHLFSGDFTIHPGANFYNAAGSVCNFIGSADQVISFDPPTTNGYFMNVTIDKSIAKEDEGGSRENRSNTVTLATDILSLSEGNLTVNYGTLDFNGHYFRALGDIKIYNGGKITIDEDAWVEVGSTDSVIVFNGGVLEVIGSAGHQAKVISHTGYHAFEIRSGGTISAKYGYFSGTGTEGLYVQSGGLINATNDFDFCTFTNGQSGANALLRIDNSQTRTIEGAVFPAIGTNKNVSKTLNQGEITFTGATGAFAGPVYENDPNGRIHWAEYGRWDGSVSADWNNPGNWGFDLAPSVSMDVLIPAGCPNYPDLTDNLGINSSSYAYACKSLTVEAGGKLTISSGYDIISFGNINSAGDLIIGDDYYGNNGSVFNITADTCKFGMNSSTGYINLNSGAEINMTNSVLMAESFYINSGSWWHGYNSNAHLTAFGSAPVVQYVLTNDEDSYFSTLIIDAGVNATMGNSTYDLYTSSSLKVYGTFTNFGKTVSANYMDVYGTLNLDSGLVEVRTNGPYFTTAGILNMTGGTLDAGNEIRWNPGSSANVSGGEIYAATTYTVTNGTAVTIGTGNTVYFSNSGTSNIDIQDSDAVFGNVDMNKPADVTSGTYLKVSSTFPMVVAGNLYLRSGNQLHLQGEDLTVQGALINEAGSEMDMITGADFINNGDYTLNGSLTNPGGNVTIHGRFAQSTTGVLTISGGSFINDKALTTPSTSIAGTLNLSNGIFEITHMSTSFAASFIDNISGGTMRFGSTINAPDNCFQPSGGTVELINFSGSGSPYLQIGMVNYLQNLTVNSNILWYISGSGASQLRIWKDLTINSGGLNGSDDIVYVGDDWTNNVGSGGFLSGNGSVYLIGTAVPPERQVISGTNTFNLLYNVNTDAIVEFAGPTTVNDTYFAGQGGAECETFITGTAVNIQTLHLSQGNFALSTSIPTVTVSSLVQGGTVQVTNGNFTVDDLVDNDIRGTYTIYNGQINLNQDPAGFLDLNANLNINGGTINVDGGQDNSYWPYFSAGSITMSAGVLDFKSTGIILNTGTFTENITGGVIRTVGLFQANTGVTFFTPSGGAVEMYGDDDSQISLQAGCYFHDLYSSKTSPAIVYPTKDMTVKGELRVKSSSFETSGYLVNVGE